MVQICDGLKTKGEIMAENVDRYKDMFMRTKHDFQRIVAVSFSGSPLCVLRLS